MNKGKYKALENIYSFSPSYEDDADYTIYIVSEKDLQNYIVIRKDEIIDYQGGCGRIDRGHPVDVDFEGIYKVSPESFEFLGSQ